MGTFRYAGTDFHMPDEDLRYLQIATEVGLHGGRGFAVELRVDEKFTAVYVAPGVPIEFHYTTADHPIIDPAVSARVEEKAVAGQALQMWESRRRR